MRNESSTYHTFHPDHLGSTSYVTGADGTVAQHVEYIPYGEVFVEERNSSFLTSYLFNAKELDDETGMYYYGARYLDPTGGMWISVDPMWEKFAGMSAYNYCVGNPVKMVDPDGEMPQALVPVCAGALVCGGGAMVFAVLSGKSAREVCAAGVGGTVAGGLIGWSVGVKVLGMAAKSFYVPIVDGAIGCAIGNFVEQNINFFTDEQNDINWDNYFEKISLSDVGISALVGAVGNIGAKHTKTDLLKKTAKSTGEASSQKPTTPPSEYEKIGDTIIEGEVDSFFGLIQNVIQSWTQTEEEK